MHICCASSVDEHLGCFCLLATVNNAAISTNVQISSGVLLFILSGVYL